MTAIPLIRLAAGMEPSSELERLLGAQGGWKEGDFLQGRILDRPREGEVLIDFGSFRLLARTDLPLRSGDPVSCVLEQGSAGRWVLRLVAPSVEGQGMDTGSGGRGLVSPNAQGALPLFPQVEQMVRWVNRLFSGPLPSANVPGAEATPPGGTPDALRPSEGVIDPLAGGAQDPGPETVLLKAMTGQSLAPPDVGSGRGVEGFLPSDGALMTTSSDPFRDTLLAFFGPLNGDEKGPTVDALAQRLKLWVERGGGFWGRNGDGPAVSEGDAPRVMARRPGVAAEGQGVLRQRVTTGPREELMAAGDLRLEAARWLRVQEGAPERQAGSGQMQDGLQSAVRAFLNQPVWWQQTGSRSRETGSSEVGGQNWVLGLTVPLDAQEAPLHLKVYYNQAETEESGRGGRNQKRFHMAVLLDLTALGPLRADLIQDAGLLSVRIQVRRPQTLTWMQEEVEALRFALEEGQDLPVRLLLEADRGHIARFFTEDVLEDREEGESVGTGPGQIDVKV